MTPVEKWKWYGFPAHFICSSRCQFRMATEVGNYIISTVGAMRDATGNSPDEQIGYGRTFETMVFIAERHARCRDEACGCGMPDKGDEVETLPANTAGEAQKNHMKLCRKYARKA